MSIDLSKKNWLSALVEAELAGYDPAQARLRLPPELRLQDADGPDLEARARLVVLRSVRQRIDPPEGGRPDEAFLSPIRGHIDLVLDLALLQAGTFEPGKRRAEIATFFAAACGDVAGALDADPGEIDEPDEGPVRRGLARAGVILKKRTYPAGDPVDGLPLYPCVLSVQRRLLARLAIGYYARGHLEKEAARRQLLAASRELALLAEMLAGMFTAGAPLDAARRRTWRRQVTRLGLQKLDEKELLERVSTPRSPAQLARVVLPVAAQTFVEHLALAEVAAGASPERAAWLEALAAAAGIQPEELVELRARAAIVHADYRHLFQPSGDGDDLSPADWEDAADEMLEKVSQAVSDNLDAVVAELKETGSVSGLVAKAAAGTPLTADEKRRVKVILIDLAKAVPALAIFAAPGGMLLLPLLAKLLPFDVLPSAWSREGKPGRKSARAREKA
ncbi:LETM1 domain-containing protein [Anaeromyxobacter paludicola]|uniref:LETM1-like protein n=1 Tax=Anaeromyxobacter paludicola TaxID=2918171 RepID=A0ABN6N7V4_9BACT|nr:LETM1 domain-containing protein [Anaeromyxobacter paludicola]BDG09266.1 hypothetical protein AMPC_23790 [Anaeromyxobacter paludicola]